jgi:phage shock protein C
MIKLYRVPEEKFLAGICAGVAEILHVDVTFVRLAFVFACVITSILPLVITYLVGWYIIPEKPYKGTDNTRTDATA